ncbi:MAG TPA: prepilin-type N-terminal cleavage/methylation domain-containing protein [Pirellulaceae bacterium]|nr:prepilin-type N-terminal cleavage/methylation domain-containing protein [Pirellulaceae bacterium]
MKTSPHRDFRQNRAGITLLELMIVLSLLAIIAAVSMPAFAGMLRSQRLRSAAESVRTEWMRAHIRAMKTGRIHVYRFENGGRHFEIIPWVSDDDALESSTNADAQTMSFSMATASGTAAGGVDVEDGPGLPEGVIFVGGEASADSRGISVAEALSGSGGSEGQMGAPVLFYPDGSATDAYVIVANDQQQAVRVELRGLTGLATVGEIMSLEELLH